MSQPQNPPYSSSGYPPPGPGNSYPANPSAYPNPPYSGAPAAYPASPPAYPGAPSAYPGAPSAYPGAPDTYAGNPGGYVGNVPAQSAPPAYPGNPVAYAGNPAPQNAPLAVTACRLCGSVPAVDVTFRGHQGMLVIMRFLSTPGPLCRDCGLSVFRHMTSRTLVQGWYGYASFVITPITVLLNWGRRGKVARLAAPHPHPYGPSRPPANPGPGLFQRPMTWLGLAVPLLMVGLLVVAVNSH